MSENHEEIRRAVLEKASSRQPVNLPAKPMWAKWTLWLVVWVLVVFLWLFAKYAR
jgi:hypothetical protein